MLIEQCQHLHQHGAPPLVHASLRSNLFGVSVKFELASSLINTIVAPMQWQHHYRLDLDVNNCHPKVLIFIVIFIVFNFFTVIFIFIFIAILIFILIATLIAILIVIFIAIVILIVVFIVIFTLTLIIIKQERCEDQV